MTGAIQTAISSRSATLRDQPSFETLTPSALSLSAALVLGLFCTALALMLYFRLVVTLGPVGVASQAYLRAGVAVVLGMVFLGESFSALVACGIALALAGVVLINWPRR